MNNIISISKLRKIAKSVAQNNNVKGAIVITLGNDEEHNKISVGVNNLTPPQVRYCLGFAIHSLLNEDELDA